MRSFYAIVTMHKRRLHLRRIQAVYCQCTRLAIHIYGCWALFEEIHRITGLYLLPTVMAAGLFGLALLTESDKSARGFLQGVALHLIKMVGAFISSAIITANAAHLPADKMENLSQLIPFLWKLNPVLFSVLFCIIYGLDWLAILLDSRRSYKRSMQFQLSRGGSESSLLRIPVLSEPAELIIKVHIWGGSNDAVCFRMEDANGISLIHGTKIAGRVKYSMQVNGGTMRFLFHNDALFFNRKISIKIKLVGAVCEDPGLHPLLEIADNKGQFMIGN